MQRDADRTALISKRVFASDGFPTACVLVSPRVQIREHDP